MAPDATDDPVGRDDEHPPAYWRAYYHALPCAVLLLEGASTVVDANPAACRLLELPAERAMWTGWWRRIRQEASVDDALHAGRDAAQAQPVQVALARRDGSRCWLQLAFAPFAPDASMSGESPTRTRYALCAIQDISAQKAAEAALQASEERYNRLFGHAFDGVYTVDLTGRFTSVNQTWLARMGYTHEEALAMTIDRIVDPAHVEAARRSFARKLDGTAKRRIELDCRCKDGTVITAEVSSSILYENGRPAGLLGIARDVTERKRMEAALRASEQRLRAVVSNAPVILFALDAAGVITLAEGRGLDALGLAGAEVIGQSIFDYARAAPGLPGDAHRALMGEELTTTREIGGAVFEMRYMPMRDDGIVTGVIGVATDITERIRAEEALRHQAQHDALTGLPNRALLRERLECALASGTAVALLLLDLNHFKEVNDTLGHDAGDRLLREVGARVRDTTLSSDTVARLGGDEFAVLLPATELVGATRASQKILAALTAPIVLSGTALGVGASIGISACPEHGSDPTTLLRCADVAMYVAKRRELGYAVYDAAQDQHTLTRLGAEGALRRARTRERGHDPAARITAQDARLKPL